MSDDKLDVIIQELRDIARDHERRIRILERLAGYGSGAIGMGLFLLKVTGII